MDGGACVDADDIAFVQHDAMGRNAVDNDVVHRDACTARETAQALEIGPGSLADDIIVNDLVDLSRRNARLDGLAAQPQRLCRNLAGRLHGLDFFCCFNEDHRLTPSFSSRSLVVSATSSCPSTTTSLPRSR